MSQERTEAIVLRTVDFSETSRIVTFLTPARGRLACMMPGARRKKNAAGGLLDIFNRLEMLYCYKETREVQRLGEVTLLDGFTRLKQDLDKAMYAAYPLELVTRVAQVNEPSFRLYATLVYGLESLSRWTGDVRAHTVWQVYHLLAAAGFEPLADEVERALSRRLSGQERRMLACLSDSPDACPEDDNIRITYELLRVFVRTHTGMVFKSLQVIDQVCGIGEDEKNYSDKRKQ